MSSEHLIRSPLKSLNKAYRKQKPNRQDIELFKKNLQALLDELNENESEEHIKNDVKKFLSDTWYGDRYAINTKDRTDLVIHNDKTAKSSAGVLLEVKRPTNKGEMVSKDNLNAKALQELVLYYLRERVEEPENRDIKHIIITNVYEWFIFDSAVFYDCFYKNRKLVKAFHEWSRGQKESTSTPHFFSEIAKPAIEQVKDRLEFTHFDLREYSSPLKADNALNKLIPLYKILSPTHLLKLPFANDSNSLNRQFYHELLHIIGLEEIKEKGKKIIRRKEKGKRNEGSLLENAINIIDSRDRLYELEKPSQFGPTKEEQLYAVALELCITWINRILFLKLLESQLKAYHKGSGDYTYLNIKTVPNFDELDSLFFDVLAKKHEDRQQHVRDKYAHVPYLNSSLFEPSELERKVIYTTNLHNDKQLELYTQTVLQNEKGKRLSGKKDTLSYLFDFLDAYDFSSEGKEEVQEENKSLINASVLGLIFEKINGYKDGSFYTPGFITMYMCRETIRRAVVQKFNEANGWNLETFDQLYDKIEDKREANTIINSLKICDPAVGSGHFLVSALNEMIAIKSELKILMDKDGKTLRDYEITIENDELIISDDNGEFFQYTVGSKEKQRVQEVLFHEKQTIIENCLFGVDINPNSVKICRLRLWIELLKHAYYIKKKGVESSSPVCYADGEEVQADYRSTVEDLQTLPNIDINIKCGNSLISRFGLDEDLSKALKSIKYSIDDYKSFVNDYKNATDKEAKRGFKTLIDQIKSDFRTEIAKNDPKIIRRNKLGGELYNLMNQAQAFEPTEKQKKEQEKKKDKLETQINKLSVEIDEIKSSKIYEDAFEWRFEFPEVLDDAGHFVGFDVVIGNPPYIRQESLSDVKPYLSDHFQTFTGTADLYVYFVELGMRLLQDDGGFTFIIPNKWMRAGYGQKLRQFVKRHHIHQLLDYGDLPVFEEATTYPLIIELSKHESVSEFNAVNFTTLDFEPDMSTYIQKEQINVLTEELSDQGWTLTDSKVQKLLAKLRSKGKPLGEYVNEKIYRGVLTGLNEAFVIDQDTRDQLIAEDPNSEEIIKPFLAGRDIKRYQKPTVTKYLIFTRRGIEIEQYPAILKHLDQYRQRLEPKPKGHKGDWKGRKPGSYKWYEIQDAVDYYEEFEKEKIAWPETSLDNQFTLVESGHYLNKTAFIIPVKDNSLLCQLNSRVAKFYFDSIVSKMRGGYFSMSKAYVETFPIIHKISEEVENSFKERVEEIRAANKVQHKVYLEKIDQLVYELYGLTEEEIAIVEGGTNV